MHWQSNPHPQPAASSNVRTFYTHFSCGNKQFRSLDMMHEEIGDDFMLSRTDTVNIALPRCMSVE